MSSNDLKPFGMLKANSNKVTLSSIQVSFSSEKPFPFSISSSQISPLSPSKIHTSANKNNWKADFKTGKPESNKLKPTVEAEAPRVEEATIKANKTIWKIKSRRQSSLKNPTSNGKMFQDSKVPKMPSNKPLSFPSSSLKSLRVAENPGKEFYSTARQELVRLSSPKLVPLKPKELSFPFHHLIWWANTLVKVKN